MCERPRPPNSRCARQRISCQRVLALRRCAGRPRDAEAAIFIVAVPKPFFGEGKANARTVLIGEIPGSQEDRIGRPFVGPAGRLLRRALLDAEIPLESVYITNAVKHFKWITSGKRRVGMPPSGVEIQACLPWLTAELQIIKPRVLCCLGVSAATAVLARRVRIKDVRSETVPTRTVCRHS